MKWNETLFESGTLPAHRFSVSEKPVCKTCVTKSQSQSGMTQDTGDTGQKQHVIKNVCKGEGQAKDVDTDPRECVESDVQADLYMETVRREAAEARAKHDAWRVTLRPAPKHTVSPLLDVEEQHLKDFIASKLVVAPRRGDTFYHMSGSDLWWLQGQYEQETGYVFRMRPDFLPWHIAQVTGAKVMVDPQGQEWLIGVSYC